GEVVVHGQRATVDVHTAEQPGPPGLPALAWPRRIGLEVAPVYRDAETEEVYPYLLASLRRQLTEALECAAYRYACTATPLGPPHPTALGRRHLEPAAQEVDRRLAEASGTFRFLLQVTPVNARETKARFFEGGCEQGPTFQYRPLPVDPERLKRDLFALPVEAVEDPVLAELFREKQEELDRRVTMLRDRGTRRFFYGSLALYGEPSEALRALAHELLARLPDSDDPAAEAAPPGTVDAAGFAAAAAAEFDAYRAACPDFPAYPDLRGDIPPGLLVSQGQLLIGQGTTVPHARVEALVQHEVGTHMATYYNGRAQPLEVLRIGLAHYEALQEGLAVLAEYVVGGLTVPRLRVLAARVVAAQALIDDASFVEVFRLLTREHGFDRDTAWTVAMRTFRGGGMIKDVIYLRGLDELARHLREGGALEPLLVGKLALHHLPAVEALRRRGVLSAPLLRPRWLDAPHAPEALERLRAGLTFVDLFARSPEPSTPPA
ncbi:MAG: flavohemoglobin expression-modulating QEGLA motif protein, partial [Rhodothermales bacterium]|nr:flavohemoglobin expression-modulating QEGLA motif protein [Rhodothermales bacterium]